MLPEEKPMNDNKPSRLGRGLAALIGDMATAEGVRGGDAAAGGVQRVPISSVIANRANPRREFDPDQLEELANSVREKGVMQPLLVRPTSEAGQYEIIAGERRWRAAMKAGLHELPIIVREVSDREALELAIIENVQRVDLNPLEEAQGYGQLIDQFSYTQQDLAQVIGKSRSHVANTLRLLRLPPDVRDMLARGELTAGHARTLITAEDPAGLARRIVSSGLSVREAEALSQRGAAGKKRAPEAKSMKDPDTVALERRLSDALGLAVTIDHKGEGGRIEVRYRTLEQLDAVCVKLSS